MKKKWTFLANLVVSLSLIFICTTAVAKDRMHAVLDRIAPNNAIYSMVQDKAHHALFVGGSFTRFGIKTGGGAIFNSSGHLIASPPTFDGRVFASIADGHGGYYVGGDFTHVSVTGAKYLAHMNAAGVVDSAFMPAIPAAVRHLAIVGPSLYVATDRQVFEVNLLSGKINTHFSLTTDESIYSMAASPFGVYIGGIFSQVNGEPVPFFAKASRNTGVVDTGYYNPGVVVKGMVVTGNDELFLETYIAEGKVIKLHLASGEVDTDFNIGRLRVIPHTIAVNDQWLYMSFGQYPYVRRYDRSTGKLDLFFNIDINRHPMTMNFDNNYIYLTGPFDIIEGRLGIRNIARFDKNTFRVDRSYTPVVSQRVVTTTVGNNGQVFYGGYFISAGDIAANHIAKIDLNTGLLDSTFSASVNGNVYGLVVDNDRLFVAGDYTGINNSNAKKLALLSSQSGVVDATFKPQPSGPVFVLKKHRGYLFAGGRFLYVGGHKVDDLTRFKLSDLSQDTRFNFGQDNTVWDLAFKGKYLFVGGDFTHHLSSYSLDTGVKLTAFKPQIDGRVNRLLFDTDHLYVAGRFTGRVARLNPRTGGRRPKFLPSITGSAFALARHGDYLYVSTQSGLVRLDSVTGEQDAGFKPNADGLVFRTLVDGDELLVAGQFTHIADQFEPYLSSLELPAT